MNHPREYLDFVALSVVESAVRIARAFGVGLLAALALASWVRRRWLERSDWEILFLTTAIGLVPLVLLSFVHVRYCARFAPLVVLYVLLVLEHAPRLPRAAAIAITLGLALGVWQAGPSYLPTAADANWFPD